MKKKDIEEIITELDQIIEHADDIFAIEQSKRIKYKLIDNFNNSLPEEGFHFRDINAEDPIPRGEERDRGMGGPKGY